MEEWEAVWWRLKMEMDEWEMERERNWRAQIPPDCKCPRCTIEKLMDGEMGWRQRLWNQPEEPPPPEELWQLLEPPASHFLRKGPRS